VYCGLRPVRCLARPRPAERRQQTAASSQPAGTMQAAASAGCAQSTLASSRGNARVTATSVLLPLPNLPYGSASRRSRRRRSSSSQSVTVCQLRGSDRWLRWLRGRRPSPVCAPPNKRSPPPLRWKAHSPLPVRNDNWSAVIVRRLERRGCADAGGVSGCHCRQ
jgi:hypothetical protein